MDKTRKAICKAIAEATCHQTTAIETLYEKVHSFDAAAFVAVVARDTQFTIGEVIEMAGKIAYPTED